MAKLDYRKPPRWMRMKFVDANGKGPRYEMSVKLWHPCFWVWFVKQLGRELASMFR